MKACRGGVGMCRWSMVARWAKYSMHPFSSLTLFTAAPRESDDRGQSRSKSASRRLCELPSRKNSDEHCRGCKRTPNSSGLLRNCTGAAGSVGGVPSRQVRDPCMAQSLAPVLR